MKNIITPILIGAVTSLMGFPCSSNGEIQGKNIVILTLCVLIWSNTTAKNANE